MILLFSISISFSELTDVVTSGKKGSETWQCQLNADIKRLNLPESAKKPTYKAIYIYPSFFPYKYNVKAARKWGVLAYGGNKNDSESWYRIKENYEGKTGNFTTYTNYKGETWTENY